MDRRLQLNDLPNELITSIIDIASLPSREEINDPDEAQWLNRVTRSAKLMRRVCRFWKSILDKPSSFRSRLTTAFLYLRLAPSSSSGPAFIVGLDHFRDHLEQSKSLLAIHMRVTVSMPRGPQNEGYSTHERRQIEMFCEEITRLAPCQNRLIKVNAHIEEVRIAAHLLITLTSTGPHPNLIDLEIHTRNPQLASANLQLTPEGSLSTPSNSSESGMTFDGLYQSLPALRKLSTSSSCFTGAIAIPSTLTSLDFILQDPDFTMFRPNTLLSPITGIKELNLTFPERWEPEDVHSVVNLDQLVSLEISGDSIALAEFLLLLSCERLAHLKLEVEYNFALGDFHPEAPRHATFLPNLKTLQLEDLMPSSLRILIFMDIPHVLEKFTIIELYSTYEDETQDMDPDQLLNWIPMERIRSHSLEICTMGTTCFFFFKLYRNTAIVRNLRLTATDVIGYTIEQHLDFKPLFTELQSLAIVGTHVHIMSLMISGICAGDSLRTIDIIQKPGSSDAPSVSARHRVIWDEFVAEVSSQGQYSGIRTLATAWPSTFPRFIQTLFDLTPHIRTLILKTSSSESDQRWPLEELEPTQAVSIGKGVRIPSVECVIVEYRSPCTMETLERLRPLYEGLLPILQAARLRAGADPIQTVILNSFSNWDVPESMDYPQECGILLRIEAVDGATFRR